jgi:HEXXH motif-containing protein
MLTAAGRYAVTDRWAEWKRAYRNISHYDSTFGIYFKVIETDPVFAEEARDLSNPDVSRTLDLCEGMSPQDTKLLETAIELINLANGRCREVVSVGLDTLAILELPPNMPAGSCISFTSRSAPGAIFLTMTAPILLAESIVHEAVHNVLYTATRLSQVTLGGRKMLRSPLRKDLRPLEGVIHQAVVLDYLCEFYDRILQYPSIDSVSRNISQITKRLYKCREDKQMALTEIYEVADDLGPLGLEIVGMMHRRIVAY